MQKITIGYAILAVVGIALPVFDRRLALFGLIMLGAAAAFFCGWVEPLVAV